MLCRANYKGCRCELIWTEIKRKAQDNVTSWLNQLGLLIAQIIDRWTAKNLLIFFSSLKNFKKFLKKLIQSNLREISSNHINSRTNKKKSHSLCLIKVWSYTLNYRNYCFSLKKSATVDAKEDFYLRVTKLEQKRNCLRRIHTDPVFFFF